MNDRKERRGPECTTMSCLLNHSCGFSAVKYVSLMDKSPPEQIRIIIAAFLSRCIAIMFLLVCIG